MLASPRQGGHTKSQAFNLPSPPRANKTRPLLTSLSPLRISNFGVFRRKKARNQQKHADFGPFLAPMGGLEPLAYRLGGGRSIQTELHGHLRPLF